MVSISRAETQAKLDKQAAGALMYKPTQFFTVADLFEKRAIEQPQKDFIRWNDETISYALANATANRIANTLHALGIRNNHVVALMMENSPYFLFAWIALAKLGIVAALINTESRNKVLVHAVKTTKSSYVLIGRECLDKWEAIKALFPTTPAYVLDSLDSVNGTLTEHNITHLNTLLTQHSEQNPVKTLRATLKGADTFSLVFTSGTTGLSKAAYITHMRWLGTGESWKRLLDLNSDTVFYCVLPLFHGAAGMSLLSSVLASGGAMVLRKGFSVHNFWRDVHRHNIHFAQYSGEMCRYLLNLPTKNTDSKHSLRFLTGAGLNATIYAAFKKRFGVEHIIEGYGGTELNIGMMNVDGVAGSCGRVPFKEKSNVRLVKYDIDRQCHVRNKDGFMVECGANEVGEVIGMIIEQDNIAIGRFEGYTDGAATEAKILRNVFNKGDKWMSSGDLMRRDAEDYFYFIDRLGDSFRWKSENVSTTEVSEALSAYPNIASINVYGVEIPEQEGRAGMATIVMSDGISIDGTDLYRFTSERLATYAIPMFLRLSTQEDVTATLKLRKINLQRRSYAHDNPTDTLFVCDHANKCYLAMNDQVLKRLKIPLFRRSDTVKSNGDEDGGGDGELGV